jgi:hypothetical protein
MSPEDWVASFIGTSLFWKWILSWGGAEWLEGWRAGGRSSFSIGSLPDGLPNKSGSTPCYAGSLVPSGLPLGWRIPSTGLFGEIGYLGTGPH